MLIYMTPKFNYVRVHDFVLSNGYRSIPENTLRYMVFARLYMFLFLTHFRPILYSTAKVAKVYSM